MIRSERCQPLGSATSRYKCTSVRSNRICSGIRGDEMIVEDLGARAINYRSTSIEEYVTPSPMERASTSVMTLWEAARSMSHSLQ